MSRVLTSLFVTLALFCSASCGGADTHEKAAEDGMSIMEDLTDTLAGITDKASADKAKPELEKIIEKMKAVDARMKELGDPTPEQEKAMQEMEGMEELMGKFVQEAMRIASNPEIAAALEETMAEMQKLSK